jgi:hypothetical protein
MVILRPTRKLQPHLPISAPSTAVSDTLLGDWYVNRLTIDRKPLLILLSSRSLLSIVLPARDVRTLPDRLAEIVATRLRRLGVASPLIDAETAAMPPVVIAPTVDRSVLGILNNFVSMIPFYLDPGWDETSFPFLESRLAQVPCHVTRRNKGAIFPYRKAVDLMARLSNLV